MGQGTRERLRDGVSEREAPRWPSRAREELGRGREGSREPRGGLDVGDAGRMGGQGVAGER